MNASLSLMPRVCFLNGVHLQSSQRLGDQKAHYAPSCDNWPLLEDRQSTLLYFKFPIVNHFCGKILGAFKSEEFRLVKHFPNNQYGRMVNAELRCKSIFFHAFLPAITSIK